MTNATRFCSLLPFAVIAASGCSDDKDWEHEVILQLFKSEQQKATDLKIAATQAGTNEDVSIDNTTAFFSSCDSNRVRIIPQTDNGKVAIPIDVTISGGGFTTITREIDKLDVTKIIIGEPASALIPECTDTPDYQPDASVDAALYETGESCTDDGQCEDGHCLKALWIGSSEVNLPKGYCATKIEEATDCSSNDCVEGTTVCHEDRQPDQKVVGVYCLKYCKTKEDCRQGYKCTPGNACFPE